MNIVIPMAGEGQRFIDVGYKVSKPAILTTSRRTGKNVPMVACAVMDLPGVLIEGGNVIFIERLFHRETGVENEIKKCYPKAAFMVADKLTEGQACTCLLAKKWIDNEEQLLIAGCDNGMVFDKDKFMDMTSQCDVLAFTYRHNQSVLKNPDAYGWVMADESTKKITDLSIKKAISNNPLEDYAIVATFWFKHGSDFVQAAEKMIIENDRINNEFYVDQVMKHCIELGLDTRVFEIDRYIGWGTPEDYEEYQATIRYWSEFTASKKFLAESNNNVY